MSNSSSSQLDIGSILKSTQFGKNPISSIDRYGDCLLPQRLRLNLLADSLDHGHRLVANIKQASFLWLAIR